MQDNKFKSVMMVAAVSAALMGAGHVGAFAQSAESEERPSSGGSGLGQVLSELLFNNGAAQNSATSTNNSPDDSDSSTVAGTNAPEQTQEEQIATDVEEAEDSVGTELLPLIEELFVDIDAEDSIGAELLPLIEELLGSFVG